MAQSLADWYSIKSPRELQDFLESYLPLIRFTASQYQIDLTAEDIKGDHLGLQVVSAQEFDDCHQIFSRYCQQIHDSIIHRRRNRIYRFNKPLQAAGVSMPRIEIFEPKPNIDPATLRPGIEHISFTTDNWEQILDLCRQNKVPIDKVVEDSQGKFFKTQFLNCVEIEFRNDELGEWDHK